MTRRRLHWVLLFLVLAIAAYLRLRGWPHNPIVGDQSILVSIAMRFVNKGAAFFPLAANKSSAGIMNPPLIEYLYMAPLLVHASLTAVHLFQALLSVAAVAVLYFYAARLLGRRVALVAALLFAVNPWAVYYGRFLWNPNPIPFFSTLLLMGLLAYFAGRPRPIHLALSFLWLAAVTQLHLSGLALVGVMGIIFLLFWRRWQRPSWPQTLWPIAGGGLLALLLYAPFLMYENAVGFQNIRALTNAFLGQSEAVTEAMTNTASVLLAQELASGSGFMATAGIPPDAVWPLAWLTTMAQVLVGVALIYAWARPLVWLSRRDWSIVKLPARETVWLILALWMSVPVLFYLRHTVHLQNYYFLYLFPAPPLMLALLADELGRWWQSRRDYPAPATTALTIAPLLLLALWHGHLHHVRLTLLEAGEIGPDQQVATIADLIRAGRNSLSAYPTCDLIVVADGSSLETSALGLLEDFVYPTPVRFIDRGRGYIEPATCSVYLSQDEGGPVDGWLAETAVSLPNQVPGPDGNWRFHYVAGDKARPAATSLAAWQNGLQLIDVRMDGEARAGSQLQLRYTWQVRERPPEHIRYHFFNHLLHESGQLVAQEDAAAIKSLYWQAGDRLVTQFNLQLPAELANGRHSLLVGLYTWPDLQRIPLQSDTAANPPTTYQVTTFQTPDK